MEHSRTAWLRVFQGGTRLLAWARRDVSDPTDMTSEPVYLFHEYLPWVVVAISLLLPRASAFAVGCAEKQRGPIGADQDGEPTALLRKAGRTAKRRRPLVQWSPDMLRQILRASFPTPN